MIPADIRRKDQLKCVWWCDHLWWFPGLPAQGRLHPPTQFPQQWSVVAGCLVSEISAQLFDIPHTNVSHTPYILHTRLSDLILVLGSDVPGKAAIGFLALSIILLRYWFLSFWVSYWDNSLSRAPRVQSLRFLRFWCTKERSPGFEGTRLAAVESMVKPERRKGSWINC